MSRPMIGVMGPGEGATEGDRTLAYQLGQRIAQQNWILLTGGRNVGVMDAASQGAKQAGGLTVGILPDGDRAQMSSAVDIPILTAMGSGRNIINILSSTVIVACGMGAGTASELALAIKAQKPVILLNPEPLSQAFFTQLSQNLIQAATTPDEVIHMIQHWLIREKVAES